MMSARSIAIAVGIATGAQGAYVAPPAGAVGRHRPQADASAARAAADVVMSTEVQFGDASRRSLLAGIDAVANAVKVTLGPKGRNVVLERSYGVPEVVNDGVTIARDIELEDPRANVGARLLVEVASKTDQRAGDGTTTSSVLTQALVTEGLRLVASGANAMALQRGLQKASKLLAEEIKAVAKPVDSDDDIMNIATIATGSEGMGRTIANTFKRVGVNGATMVEDGQVRASARRVPLACIGTVALACVPGGASRACGGGGGGRLACAGADAAPRVPRLVCRR